MVVVVRENLPTEVKEFKEKFWPEEPIYLDHKFEFYSALFGGEPHEINKKYFGTQFGLFAEGKANPEFTADITKALGLTDGFADKGNMTGSGLMTGGVYVIKKGGEVQWAHQEEKVGFVSAAADVLEQALKAADA